MLTKGYTASHCGFFTPWGKPQQPLWVSFVLHCWSHPSWPRFAHSAPSHPCSTSFCLCSELTWSSRHPDSYHHMWLPFGAATNTGAVTLTLYSEETSSLLLIQCRPCGPAARGQLWIVLPQNVDDTHEQQHTKITTGISTSELYEKIYEKIQHKKCLCYTL